MPQRLITDSRKNSPAGSLHAEERVHDLRYYLRNNSTNSGLKRKRTQEL